MERLARNHLFVFSEAALDFQFHLAYVYWDFRLLRLATKVYHMEGWQASLLPED